MNAFTVNVLSKSFSSDLSASKSFFNNSMRQTVNSVLPWCILVPVRLSHSCSHAIRFCLSLARPMELWIKSISTFARVNFNCIVDPITHWVAARHHSSHTFPFFAFISSIGSTWGTFKHLNKKCEEASMWWIYYNRFFGGVGFYATHTHINCQRAARTKFRKMFVLRKLNLYENTLRLSPSGMCPHLTTTAKSTEIRAFNIWFFILNGKLHCTAMRICGL